MIILGSYPLIFDNLMKFVPLNRFAGIVLVTFPSLSITS